MSHGDSQLVIVLARFEFIDMVHIEPFEVVDPVQRVFLVLCVLVHQHLVAFYQVERELVVVHVAEVEDVNDQHHD